jgi:PKD domain-containing protein
VLSICCAAALAPTGTSHALDPGPGPSADFSFTPFVPLVGETVTFTAVAAPEPGAEITSYRWDLDGDGSNELNSGLKPTVTKKYTKTGVITVKLQMRDSWDNRIDKTHVLTVGGQPPIASFSFTPSAPVVNQPVLFTSAASDPDGVVLDQAWDLNGDGVYDNGGGSTALRTFGAPGSYVVGLRATDNEGHASFDSRTVGVAASPSLVSTLPGALGPRLLSPFPVVRLAGRIFRRGSRVRLLEVDTPPGTVVHVRCTGRGCPFRTERRAVTAGGPNANAARRIRLRLLERLLRPGVTLRIMVTSKDRIGKYTVFKIRRRKAPARTDLCLLPSSRKPIACPAA